MPAARSTWGWDWSGGSRLSVPCADTGGVADAVDVTVIKVLKAGGEPVAFLVQEHEVQEVPASPALPGGVMGRASHIASLTSATRPARSRNRSYPATFRRTCSGSGPGPGPGPGLRRRAPSCPPPSASGCTAARAPDDPGQRTRRPASRTYAAPYSATRAGNPGLAQLPVQLLAPSFQFRQLISLAWHHRP